jgi:hypothetical protein
VESSINKATEMLLKTASVIKERQAAYGPPNNNFEFIAELWNTWVKMRHNYDISFDASDVASMFILTKISRLGETPNHADSWTDIAGYAACGLQVQND